ncbi:MAG: EAL domain-containing protein, partial [Phycisphaerales bacterium]
AGEQKKLPAYFARLRGIASERGRNDELSERINQLEQLTREWTEKAAEPEIAARRVMNEHPESLKDVSALLEAGTGKALIDEIRLEFDKFIATEERHAALSYGSASETTVATRNIAIAFLILATCLGVITAVLTGRAVALPLAKLARGVEAVGRGDLQTRIEGESSGDIGSLIRAFNAMATDLCESQDKLEAAATTDKLTGLPNRALFLDRLEQALKQSRRNSSRFAVLFFDFDRFKVVNDSLGHEIGDTLLCKIGDIFRANLRESDTVARIGGDEFVLLLTDLSEWSDARMKSERFLEAFAKPHFLGGHRVVSTASIGLVTNKRAYESANEMIRDADAAMYQAKDAGKGRVVVFDQAMHERAIDRLTLEEDLHEACSIIRTSIQCDVDFSTLDDELYIALGGDQFRLVYQPIVSLETGELSGLEALLRWNHPERGTINPVDFIPLAEETGLIVDIGRWVLHTAAQQLADWNHRLRLDHRLTVSVNLSKRELLSSSILADVLECHRQYSLQPGDLKLEVTESAIVEKQSDVIPVLRELREHGFLIAMDDFGTGLSSLGALHDYPIDILKIDRSFISALDSDRSLLAVVASITTLADNLGFTTVAEGIETEEIVGALQSVGCTWGQGYYFAKPLSASDTEVYLLGLHHKGPCAA